MFKNIALLFSLIVVIGGGIGYVFYSDPEQLSVQMFDRAMKEFAKNAEVLEKQYEKNGSLNESTKKLYLNTIASPESGTMPVINMSVSSQYVTLTFSDGNWPLANQSIILEPFTPENSPNEKSVRWKCISGSVLIRFRSKNCRLGYGILSMELR